MRILLPGRHLLLLLLVVANISSCSSSGGVSGNGSDSTSICGSRSTSANFLSWTGKCKLGTRTRAGGPSEGQGAGIYKGPHKNNVIFFFKSKF